MGRPPRHGGEFVFGQADTRGTPDSETVTDTSPSARADEDNAEHRRFCARVEHTFARMKNWKILPEHPQTSVALLGAAATAMVRVLCQNLARVPSKSGDWLFRDGQG